MHYTHPFISLHARGPLTRMQTHARTHIMYKYMYVTHVVFAVPYYILRMVVSVQLPTQRVWT